MKPAESIGLSELLVHSQGLVALVAIGGIAVLIVTLLVRRRGGRRSFTGRRRTRRR